MALIIPFKIVFLTIVNVWSGVESMEKSAEYDAHGSIFFKSKRLCVDFIFLNTL